MKNVSIIVAENFQPESMNQLYDNSYNPGLFSGIVLPDNGYSTLFQPCKSHYSVPNPANGQIIPVRCLEGAIGSTVVVVKHGSMTGELYQLELYCIII